MSVSPTRWSAAHPVFLGVLTVAVVFFGIGAWSTLTTLSGAIIAQGQIVVQQSRQIIQHPEGGVVQAIYVTDGTQVKIGSLLLRLEGHEVKSQLQIVENHLLELGAIHARLDAELTGETSITFDPELITAASNNNFAGHLIESQASIFDQKTESLRIARTLRTGKIADIQNELFGLAAQQDALQSQIDLQKEQIDIHSGLLDKGLIDQDEIIRMKMLMAQLEGQKGSLQTDAAELSGQITQLDLEINAIELQFQEDAEAERNSVVSQIADETERAKTLRQRVAELEIRAPIAGTVLGLQVTRPQTVVRAAEPLLYVIPKGGPYLVEVRIPVAEIDEVQVSQGVIIVLKRDNSGLAQELTGSVFRISADALQDERSGASYYLVTISISAASVRKLVGVHLVPGMPVTAYLRTTAQTPLQYLLKPFIDYFRNAFRET